MGVSTLRVFVLRVSFWAYKSPPLAVNLAAWQIIGNRTHFLHHWVLLEFCQMPLSIIHGRLLKTVWLEDQMMVPKCSKYAENTDSLIKNHSHSEQMLKGIKFWHKTFLLQIHTFILYESILQNLFKFANSSMKSSSAQIRFLDIPIFTVSDFNYFIK